MTRPRRRNPPRTYRNYRSYKRWLREDFAYRCGYCAIHENRHGGDWHFHVDHYRPKSRPEFRHLEAEYSNLLYSCDQCNVLKGASWPSDEPLVDGEGWLDPCAHDLSDHYYFGHSGQQLDLVVLTDVGRWMTRILALDQPARLQTRRNQAEADRVEERVAEQLDILVRILEGKYQEQPSAQGLAKLGEARGVLAAFRENINDRYKPQPFVSLRKGRAEGGRVGP